MMLTNNVYDPTKKLTAGVQQGTAPKPTGTGTGLNSALSSDTPTTGGVQQGTAPKPTTTATSTSTGTTGGTMQPKAPTGINFAFQDDPKFTQPDAPANVGGTTLRNAFAPGIAASLTQNRETDVSKITSDIMGQDSELMQLAETEGMQTANKRGMLNSSMAVGASQDAAYRVALPMASQNASQNFQANEAARARRMQGYLQDDMQSFQKLMQDDAQAFQFDQSKLDRELNVYLQDDQQRYQWRQARLERDQQLAIQRNEQEWRSAEQALERDQQRYMAAFERLMQDDRLVAEQQQQVSAMVQQANNNYTQAVANIMANPELSAKARSAQLDAVREIYIAEMTLVEDLYSVSLAFESDLPTLSRETGDDRRAKVSYIDDITARYGGSMDDRDRFYAKTGTWPQDDPYAYEDYLIDQYGQSDEGRLTDKTDTRKTDTPTTDTRTTDPRDIYDPRTRYLDSLNA